MKGTTREACQNGRRSIGNFRRLRMTGTLLCRATSHEDHTLRPILAVKGWSRDLGGAVHDPAELAEEAAEEGKQIQVTEVVNLAAAVANEMPSAEMAKQMALMAASGC